MKGGIVYVSFDVVPAPKGAAVHIEQFGRALGSAYRAIDLVTVASPDRAPFRGVERWPGVRHTELPARGKDLITRALHFRSELARWWGSRRFAIAHFRSIFEGYPLARGKGQLCDRVLYEVNGVPSIELKYHYPAVAEDDELLSKLRAQEEHCLRAADLVVTPSPVTARYVAQRGAAEGRIRVIPNGVDTEAFAHRAPRPWGEREVRMLYAGTVTRWQGVHVALQALALYRRDHPARLTTVGPMRNHRERSFRDECRRLGLTDHVDMVPPLPQADLARLHHDCDVVVAPLLANDRNLVQGCCPLKVLEAMASGTPLIASDMPAVVALARNGIEALLVRPGSGKAIKDAMLVLRNDADVGRRIGTAARQRVEKRFAWAHAKAALIRAYDELEGAPPSRAGAFARASTGVSNDSSNRSSLSG